MGGHDEMTGNLFTRSRSKVLWSLRLLVVLCLVLVSQFALPRSASAGTLASDDFNRANGALGSNWTAISDGAMSISSQQVIGKANATTGDIRTAETYPSNQFSQIQSTSTALSGGQWIAAAVRLQNGGQNGYVGLYYWNFGSPELMLFKRSNGGWTQLGGVYNSGVLAAGTQLQIMAVGSTISFLQNGVTRLSVTDTSFTGGAPGIMAYGNSTADNWSGGSATATTYTVGGTVSGLSGTVVLQDNGGDNLSVTANGPFTFATSLASGAAYAVTVKTNPSGQTCTVTGESGTVGTANVTNVAVTCQSSGSLTVSYVSTDTNGVATYNMTSPIVSGGATEPLRVLTPTNPAPGVAHNFLIALPVEPGEGTNYGDAMSTLETLNAQNQYNLTIIEPSFAIDPWYADSATDPTVPDPLETVQVCPDGFVFTVTAYAAPDASDVAKVNGPFAVTLRSSPPLFCSTTVPDSPDTDPPTVYDDVPPPEALPPDQLSAVELLLAMMPGAPPVKLVSVTDTRVTPFCRSDIVLPAAMICTCVPAARTPEL